MRIWKDILCGDEMVSDSYPFETTYNGACLQVKAKMITKGAEDFGIENNDEDGGGLDDQGETVINVVDAHKLNEIELDKKAFVGYIKGYVKKLKAKLEEDGKTDRIPEFQKGATDLVKFLVSKHDELQIFTGESQDFEAGLAYCCNLDGESDPTFFYFMDGLKEEKY